VGRLTSINVEYPPYLSFIPVSMVLLNQTNLKTNKVSWANVAATKLAEKKIKARQ